MKYISLFSGIEAASVAWEPLGWEPLCFCEIDEFPSAVLAAHYPDVPNLGDITKVNWEEVIEKYGSPDVVVGGSPCQSFSIAGGRESLGGESRLMFEYIRACDEIRSPWILWENVPGVLSTRDNAFAQLLDSLQGIGYLDIAWRVLDAQFFGVAQRRRRVFLVGHLGKGGGASAVLFESESVRGNTQTSKQKREELARAAKDSARESGGGLAFAENQRSEVRLVGGDGDIAGCVPATRRGDAKNETLICQGEPCAFKWYMGAKARSIGLCDDGTSPTLSVSDSHVPAVMTNYGDEIAGTLTSRADSSPQPMGGQNIVCMASSHTNAEIDVGGVAPTLLAHIAKQPPILCMADANANAALSENMTGTLKVGGEPPIAAIPTERT